jgi:hypothetical protein
MKFLNVITLLTGTPVILDTVSAMSSLETLSLFAASSDFDKLHLAHQAIWLARCFSLAAFS